jgi:hypothetical protein
MLRWKTKYKMVRRVYKMKNKGISWGKNCYQHSSTCMREMGTGSTQRAKRIIQRMRWPVKAK